MSGFFRGWKRKVGVITLVMACVLTAAWIRSFQADYLLSYLQHSFVSVKGGLIWETPAEMPSRQSKEFIFLSRDLKKYPFVAEPFEGPTSDDKSRWQYAGFTVADYEVAATLANGTVALEVVRFYRVPYWSIVIPLTLLSAWLLLSKQPSVNRPVEPAKDQP